MSGNFIRVQLSCDSYFQKVKREVGSFLNGSGGILAFGVRSNGV